LFTLAAAKAVATLVGSACACSPVAAAHAGREPASPRRRLDAGGNVFFLLASRVTRLDVAAVFSSMGPAVTVVLSALILRERVAARQWMGVGVCLLATALLAL
jgi:drug/metabolite transporter (DMT)-like permease